MKKVKTSQRQIVSALANVSGLSASPGSATEFDYDMSTSRGPCSQIHVAVLAERVDLMIVYPMGGSDRDARVRRFLGHCGSCMSVSVDIEFQHARAFDSIYLVTCAIFFKTKRVARVALGIKHFLQALSKFPSEGI